jgi:hypothetical protein
VRVMPVRQYQQLGPSNLAGGIASSYVLCIVPRIMQSSEAGVVCARQADKMQKD